MSELLLCYSLRKKSKISDSSLFTGCDALLTFLNMMEPYVAVDFSDVKCIYGVILATVTLFCVSSEKNVDISNHLVLFSMSLCFYVVLIKDLMGIG